VVEVVVDATPKMVAVVVVHATRDVVVVVGFDVGWLSSSSSSSRRGGTLLSISSTWQGSDSRRCQRCGEAAVVIEVMWWRSLSSA